MDHRFSRTRSLQQIQDGLSAARPVTEIALPADARQEETIRKIPPTSQQEIDQKLDENKFDSLFQYSTDGPDAIVKLPLYLKTGWHYDVKAYGAIGDGSNDDTSKIEAAIAAAPAGGVIFFPPGTYKVTTTITITKAIQLMGAGMGASIINASTIASPGYIFKINGSITGTNSALTGNAAISQADVDVVDGSLFSAADWVRVRSETNFNEENETHLGELRVVESVATNKLTLTEDLADTYTTADTGTVDLVTMLDAVRVQGLKIIGRGVGDTSHWYGLQIAQARNVYVKDCWFIDCYSQSVILIDVVKFGVSNNTIENSFKTGLGYGVVPALSSRDGYVSNNNFNNCRHAFTTGGNGTYGVVRNVIVNGNTLNATDLATRIGVLHTHNVSQYITFSNNTAWAAGLVLLNGLDVLVIGNRCFQDRTANPAVLIARYAKRIKIINNHIHVTVNTATVKAAVYIVRDVEDIELSGNYIRTEHVGGTCIYISNSQSTVATTNIIIRGNHLISDQHTAILVESVQENIDFLMISDNLIEAPNGVGINIKTDATAVKRPRYVHVFGNTIAAGITGINFQAAQYFYVYNNIIKDATTGLAVLSPNASGLINADYRIHPNDYISCTADVVDQPDTESPIVLSNIELINRTGANADESRKTQVRYRGERSAAPTGGFAMLAKTEASKDGVADDDSGQYKVYVNAGSDGESPTLRQTIDSAGQIISSGTEVSNGAVGAMAGHETFAVGDGNLFIKDPGGAARNFNPTGTFAALTRIEVINTADAAETITFDSAGLNQAINQNERGIFAYDGSNWLKIYVG